MESKPNSDLIIRWIQRPSSWVPVFVFFAAVLGFALYFPAVSSYLILGIVLALMAHPIFTRLKALRFRGKAIPNSLASVVSLTALMLFFALFWLFLLPLIGYQLSNWQKINAEQVVEALDEPIGLSVRWLSDYGLGGAPVDSVLHYSPGKPISNPDIALQLRHKILNWVDVFWLGNVLGTLVSTLAGLLLAFVSGFFIAFFLLKDKDLIRPAVEKMLPVAARQVLIGSWLESRRLLTQYFNGLLLQWLLVFFLEGLGLWLIGLSPTLAISIAMVASLFNIIPYLGPILGSLMGLLLGVSAHLDAPFYQELWPLMLRMALVFFLIQQIDGYVLQPLIFSSRLHIHPLEIFLITFIGASLAGLYGLIFAVPGYTVLRVFIRQSWAALSKEWNKSAAGDLSNPNV
jgi:predicted PurR-regulated permease PerM